MTIPDYGRTPVRTPFYRRKLFGWMVFVLVAVLVVSLLNKGSQPYADIPLSDFYSQLLSGRVGSLTIRENEITGYLRMPQVIGGVGITRFRCALPQGMTANWTFLQWILEHGQLAQVTVDNNQSLLVNILVPLIPWLLIFAFIWFFVFRQLRGIRKTPTPVVVVGSEVPLAQKTG